MVSHCSGHFLGGQCGRRGRCDAAMQWIGSVTRIAYRSSHGDQALATTAAELLCPRTATHFRGRARRTTIADGTLLSGALAHTSAAAQKIQEGEKAPFSYLVIGWGSFSFGGGRMTKNLPVKGQDTQDPLEQEQSPPLLFPVPQGRRHRSDPADDGKHAK